MAKEEKETRRIEVDEKALEKIIESNKILAEKVKMLEATADKARLEWYRGTQPLTGAAKLKRCTLGTYPVKDGSFKVILGWPSLPVNEMYQDGNGNWHERQEMRLILEDNSEHTVAYIDFTRRKKSLGATILGKSVNDVTGAETLKVETDDGRKFEIDSTFINI